MTFMRTLATAFGTGMVGWVLGAANYVEPSGGDGAPLPDQPDSVLTAIRVLLAVAVTVLLTIGFVSSLLYRVTDKRLARIRYFNDKRKEVGEEGFTPEEKEEYDKLRKMLC